jgi:ubiquinone/menaquinone biosynthesis C-methylase UbiE
LSTVFDQLAVPYTFSTPPLPEDYINLIQRTFELDQRDKVIDLGCGSGSLTLALARYSSDVCGVDASQEMLRIAKSRDVQERVRWLYNSVEKLDLGKNLYKLIISFESFHLFPAHTELIRKSALALKPGGYFCVGWANYEWEEPLKDIIVKVFASHGITWKDWEYWSYYHDLPELVECSNQDFCPLNWEKVEIQSETHINDIATFLVSISKAASLSPEERKHLAQELEREFKNIWPSEHSDGNASYSIIFYRKGGPSYD